MDAIGSPRSSATGTLEVRRHPTPRVSTDELLIEVHAAGINRADLLQSKGGYAPPAGVTDILGLEVAGVVVALGDGVRGWAIGDRVCALMAGGGYAQYAAVPAGQ